MCELTVTFVCVKADYSISLTLTMCCKCLNPTTKKFNDTTGYFSGEKSVVCVHFVDMFTINVFATHPSINILSIC